MGSSYRIAASGLTVAALSLDVSANNVANALTEGFDPTELAPADLDGGGVTAKVIAKQDPLAEVRADRALLAPSGTDLAQEMVAQSRALAVYQVNLVSLKTGDEMARTLVEDVGSR